MSQQESLDGVAVTEWDGSASEKLIKALSWEWRQITAITDWESRIQDLHQENRELRRRGLWVGGPRDFLGVIQRSRHEVTHSAILAWLLHPGMRHGFGPAFLERVLARCFPGEKFEKLEEARSETEVTCGQGRVDILVRGWDFTLVIENKIDAAEGLDQCDYYYRAFAKEYRPLFVFLTPDGWPPESASDEAAEAYRTLSYQDVAEKLKEVLGATKKASRAEARSVAQSYLETLDLEFPTAK